MSGQVTPHECSPYLLDDKVIATPEQLEQITGLHVPGARCVCYYQPSKVAEALNCWVSYRLSHGWILTPIREYGF